MIALDTPPDPPDTVDITFATDNFKAGKLIGQWTKAPARRARRPRSRCSTCSTTRSSRSTTTATRASSTGMGIDTKDKKKNGDEDADRQYYDGGDYEIVCNEPTQGAEDGGRTAMENCLTKNTDINVVYTINEPAAVGAYGALQQGGNPEGVLIVSVDGGCDGVEQVKKGVIGATSQQYPREDGPARRQGHQEDRRRRREAREHRGPGLLRHRRQALITDKPVEGLDSIDTTEGSELCWG